MTQSFTTIQDLTLAIGAACEAASTHLNELKGLTQKEMPFVRLIWTGKAIEPQYPPEGVKRGQAELVRLTYHQARNGLTTQDWRTVTMKVHHALCVLGLVRLPNQGVDFAEQLVAFD